MDDDLAKRKVLKNEEKITIEDCEKNISRELLQKRKEMIIKFLDKKRERMEKNLIKEKEIKIKRIDEDAQFQKKIIEEVTKIKIKRMKEDLNILQQKEIEQLEEEEELKNLKKKIKFNTNDVEGNVGMISLDENSRKYNELKVSTKKNKKNKKTKNSGK